jgi:tetraacyldisaccharide 4'-kinase
MREPFFWRRENALAQILAPIAAIYGAVADRRMRRPGARAGLPVFCIGNLTTGGAGKTPTALTLGKLLLARGLKPAFLTRGYGGSDAGPLVVEPKQTARDVGDEALLLARLAPTIVAHDRVSGAQAAVAIGADLIVMDDGFQNPALEKDFSLVVIDGERGIGNGRVIPAGPLRASAPVQLKRTNAVLVVGDVAPATRGLIARIRAYGIPVMAGRLVPDATAVTSLRDKKLLAFAGIGHPEKFFATLTACELSLRQTRAFADHHPFSRRDADQLLEQAARNGLTLVTTEKDIARLRGDPALTPLAAATTVLAVNMAFDDEAMLRREVLDKFLAGRVTRDQGGGA